MEFDQLDDQISELSDEELHALNELDLSGTEFMGFSLSTKAKTELK
jgi:hypothetical protein